MPKKNRGKISQFSSRSVTKTHLYTKGREYSIDGVEYIGEYYLQDEQAYTGPQPLKLEENLNKRDFDIINNSNKVILDPKSATIGIPLIKYYSDQNNYIYDRYSKYALQHNYTNPKQITYKPKDSAYEVGEDTRYFIQKVGNPDNFVIEIDNYQWERIGSINGIDNGLYMSISVLWKLIGTYSYIAEYNESVLRRAQKQVPNILYAIRSFTEHAKITAF